MKPISLCFLLQGNKGFELMREYPKVLPLKVIRKTIPDVILKDTNNKEFTTKFLDKFAFISYTFNLTTKLKEKSIAAFVVVYTEKVVEENMIKEFFIEILKKLSKKHQKDLKSITNQLPEIYNKILNLYFDVRFSATTSIEISSDKEVTKSREEIDEEKLSNFEKELWD